MYIVKIPSLVGSFDTVYQRTCKHGYCDMVSDEITCKNNSQTCQALKKSKDYRYWVYSEEKLRFYNMQTGRQTLSLM